MESNIKRERSSNFSREDVELLIKIIENKKNIIENKRSDAVTWKEKEQAWKLVELEFNSTSGGLFRDARHLKLKYEALKKITRKKASAARAELYKTGGGTNQSAPLSPIEERIRNITKLSCDGDESIFDSDVVNPEASAENNKEKENVQNDENTNISCEYIEMEISLDDFSKVADKKKDSIDDETPQKKWKNWTPKALKTKKHPALSNPNQKRPFDRLAESKIELIDMQRVLLNEEMQYRREQRNLENKMFAEILQHRTHMQEMEKEAMLLKIELLKIELESKKQSVGNDRYN